MTIRTNTAMFVQNINQSVDPCAFRIHVRTYSHPMFRDDPYDFTVEQVYGFVQYKQTKSYLFSKIGIFARGMTYMVEPKSTRVIQRARKFLAKYPFKMVVHNIKADRHFADSTTRTAHTTTNLLATRYY